MKHDFRSILKLIGRCVRARCPACGEASIVERPFQIRHHCPSCDSLFKREDGFFVGAILANVVTTEFVILLGCFFGLLVVQVDYDKVLGWLFVIAVIFPLAFYHHSWSFWLTFDFIIESLPKVNRIDKRVGNLN
jgi:uncharacterized protein (DUF983 family)